MTLTIPTVETDRLILRGFEARDFAPLAELMASDASRFIGGPKRPDETWRSMASILGHWVLRGYGLWAVEEKATGDWIGQIGLWNPHGWPEPEVGWSLIPAAQGKGYATEAAMAARAYAYDTLGWQTAISLIDPANAPSQAVATRLGAAYEGPFEHPAHGTMHIWRHPSPADLAATAEAC